MHCFRVHSYLDQVSNRTQNPSHRPSWAIVNTNFCSRYLEAHRVCRLCNRSRMYLPFWLPILLGRWIDWRIENRYEIWQSIHHNRIWFYCWNLSLNRWFWSSINRAFWRHSCVFIDWCERSIRTWHWGILRWWSSNELWHSSRIKQTIPWVYILQNNSNHRIHRRNFTDNLDNRYWHRHWCLPSIASLLWWSQRSLGRFLL